MADVAVAGGGLVGQITALMLARRNHQVVLLDPDDNPPDGTADDDFLRWLRPGVPQGQHGHVFRARVGRILREEVPDVVDAMLGHGIDKADFDFGAGFEDDFALMARRPVLEAVLRRVVRAEPGVELRTERVDGLLATNRGPVPRVIGVRAGGGSVHADLVVDCCGRRSLAPKWLAEIGTQLAVNHYQPCDLHYFARHYRLRQGAEFPSTTFPDGAAFTPYGPFLAIAEDNRTFCLAGGLSKSDPCRPAFRNGNAFDRVMAAMPGIQNWVAVGTPITDVLLMGGLANRRRSLLKHRQPTVDGYLLAGDASLYTNATYGQGVALGCWQAQALAHRADLIGRDSAGLLRGVEEWTDRVLGPRYAAQVQVDEAAVAALRAGVAGAPMMRRKDPRTALLAMGKDGDATATSAFYRIDNLLSELVEVLADTALRARLEAFLDDVQEGPAGPGPLPRSEFEALLR